MNSIPISDFISELELEAIYIGKHTEVAFKTSDINRPGLQLANYFNSFDKDTALRLQVIGSIEMTYLNTLDASERHERLEKYFSIPIPCLIVTRGMEIPLEMLEEAKKHVRIILRSNLITTRFIHDAINYLDSKLAPTTTKHGELIDVYGVGIMLTGESGIGKSETALELIKMGHRLVTDDVIEIKKVANNRLIGESPEISRYFMEVRGIGIIDIRAMYGVGAIINNKPIDLIIHLETWNDNTSYDRLGMDEQYATILDVQIPIITLPVCPGRNLAIIVEVAARNLRLKNMGYNAPYELDRRILENVK